MTSFLQELEKGRTGELTPAQSFAAEVQAEIERRVAGGMNRHIAEELARNTERRKGFTNALRQAWLDYRWRADYSVEEGLELISEGSDFDEFCTAVETIARRNQ